MSSHPSAIKRYYSPYLRGLFVMDVLNAEFNPFSPYIRRLFWTIWEKTSRLLVFSVHTEVIHTVSEPLLCILTIPCTYGGYSAELHLCSATIGFLVHGGYSWACSNIGRILNFLRTHGGYSIVLVSFVHI